MGFKLQDWKRRAIRSALGLGLIGLAAQGILVPPGLPPEYLDEYMMLAGWSANIAIMVNAPVIGKITQVSFDRSMGTIGGGLLAYACFCLGSMLTGDRMLFDVFQACVSAAAGAFSCWLALRFGSELSARIFALTFFLVMNGSGRLGSPLILSLARIAAILTGVFVMLVLGVLIFPRSATIEAHRNIEQALQLIKKLNDHVWFNNRKEGADGEVPVSKEALRNSVTSAELKSTFRDGYLPLPSQDTYDSFDEGEVEEEECETVYSSLYVALGKCKENMDVSPMEIYLHHGYGHYIFMPGFSFMSQWAVRMGGWRLSIRQVNCVMLSLRRLARLLWALHLDLRGGIDKNLQSLIAPLLGKLESTCSAAIVDLIDAFPNMTEVAIDNLMAFQGLVKELQAFRGDQASKYPTPRQLRSDTSVRQKVPAPPSASPSLFGPPGTLNTISFVSNAGGPFKGAPITVATLEINPKAPNEKSEVVVHGDARSLGTNASFLNSLNSQHLDSLGRGADGGQALNIQPFKSQHLGSLGHGPTVSRPPLGSLARSSAPIIRPSGAALPGEEVLGLSLAVHGAQGGAQGGTQGGAQEGAQGGDREGSHIGHLVHPPSGLAHCVGGLAQTMEGKGHKGRLLHGNQYLHCASLGPSSASDARGSVLGNARPSGLSSAKQPAALPSATSPRSQRQYQPEVPSSSTAVVGLDHSPAERQHSVGFEAQSVGATENVICLKGSEVSPSGVIHEAFQEAGERAAAERKAMINADESQIVQVHLAALEYAVAQIGDELEELVLAIAGLMARLPHPLSY